MVEKRAFATASAYAGRLCICGGYSSQRHGDFAVSDGSIVDPSVEAVEACETEEYSRSAEYFDPASSQWKPLPQMHHRRAFATAVNLAQRLYVVGGQDSENDSGVHLREAEHFDAVASRWTTLPRMSQMRAGAAIAAVGGSLYVCGGCRQAQYHASVERYSPVSGVWETLGPMSKARADAAVATISGRLFVCGGEDGSDQFDLVECYFPDRGAWEVLPPMSRPRSGASAAALAQRLYVFGGLDGEGLTHTAECYSHEACSWEMLPAMRWRRAGVLTGVVSWM